MAGSSGFGLECVDTGAGVWAEGTCPGMVGVGDGALSRSGSGSSDSKSRSGGEGRVGPYEIGCAGRGFSRPESRAGEPWRLICSTVQPCLLIEAVSRNEPVQVRL